MTQQVRTGYRNHRGVTWGVAIALVVAIAAVLIPIASGAAPKYYIFEASPSAVCFTGAGQTQQFTLKLTNDSQNNSLGSANFTAPSFISLTPGSLSGAPLGSSLDGNTVKLRNLILPTKGSAIQVTVSATVLGTGSATWISVAKQSNSFADTPGPGNLFTSRGDPLLTVLACSYVFVKGPVDAERGSPQTVQVQLQAGGVPVSVSESLTLSALQNGAASGNFTGLGPTDPDTSGTFAGKQWTFGVTGTVLGDGYALRAGNTTSDPTFSIVDGLCPKNTTDTEPLASSCSVTSSLGGPFESGVTINNHNLDSGVEISFAAGSGGTGKCSPWNRASYKVDGQEYFFPGVRLDFGWGGGMLKVVYRVRNADWVLTEVSRGNADIEICAGARHGVYTALNGYPPSSDHPDGTGVPFTGKYGAAAWNQGDGLFWGVLSSVQNPAKVGSDPAVCARGTTDLPTGPANALETWRTWTICIPFDWDWKSY
jgi:hypothetical protein